METSSNFLLKLQLYIDGKEQLLVCGRSECGYALAVKQSQVTSHLRDKHQVAEADRRGLTKYLTRAYPKRFRNPVDDPPRANGSDAHPQLRVYDDFSCRECPYYTINYPELSKHMSSNHLNGRQASRARIQDLYGDVYLQMWTNGATRQYWTVRKDGLAIRPVAGRGIEEHLQSVYKREHERQQVQERLQSNSISSEAQTFVATGPWIERTCWPETYKGARRDILLSLLKCQAYIDQQKIIFSVVARWTERAM